jgi:hypothetical protein
LNIDVVDPEDPSTETRISESGLVKANAGQINAMKKRRPFCIYGRRPIAMREDPSLWDRCELASTGTGMEVKITHQRVFILAE